MQRRDGHECDDGGAVWVCDDGTAAADAHVGHGLRVDLWDDQGDPGGHAEGTAVVDNLCVCDTGVLAVDGWMMEPTCM